MFLNYLKGVVAKKIVKKRLSDTYAAPPVDKIRIVGILADETYAHTVHQLVLDLTHQGIEKSDIKCLILVSGTGGDSGFPTFSLKDVSWDGTIVSKDASALLNPHIDLLLNYYIEEKAPLIAASKASQAKFKAGFAAVDKKLNHLIIDSPIENPSLFVSELFRYLKILNRI